MRRTALLLLALLAMAGCGGGGSSSASSDTSSSSAAAPAHPDEAFKLAIQRDGLIPAGNDEAASASVELAKATCETFDAGGTYNAAVRQLAANSPDWDASMAGEFVDYSQKYYCPKYKGNH